MIRNKFSQIAISASIALLSLLVPAVFLPEIAPAAEDELRECDPEPTDMTVTYGDRITCELEGRGDSDIFRLQGTAGDRPFSHRRTQKPGFYENVGNPPISLSRNPVSKPPRAIAFFPTDEPRNRVSITMLATHRKFS